MLISPTSLISSPLFLVTGVFGILCIIGIISHTYDATSPPRVVQPAQPETYIPTPPKQEATNEIPPPEALASSDALSTPLAPIPSEHPIDELIRNADADLQRIIMTDVLSNDVPAAASMYRSVRGRHPPPGFEKWFEYARGQNAMTMEPLFDQIYHDIEPFWSLDPETMRNQTQDWPFLFSIRNGSVRDRSARPVSGEWMDYWGDMFKDISQYLPDVDIPINHLDESRMIVPWEDMNAHMERAIATRNCERPQAKEDMVTTYETRPELSFWFPDIPLTGLAEDGPWLSNDTMWNLTRHACPPDSKARKSSIDTDFSTSPKFLQGYPPNSHRGYVANWTSARDICQHPHLRNYFGTFVNPRFISINTTLFPLFSGCKIAGINNEILLPAAKYLSAEEEFSFNGTDSPWSEKQDEVLWRGQATGGAHKEENWKRFHRHRFVSMLNGTFVSAEERTHNEVQQHRPSGPTEVKGAFAGIDPSHPEATDWKLPHHIPLPQPPRNPYNLSALSTTPQTTLGQYLGSKTNVGFDHLMCWPWVWSILGDGQECGYMNDFYSPVERVTMGEMFSYKYLPDVDGNSYSGRYRAFLNSGSMPIKATIWSEWHDSRLVPWKHFVPVDNTYMDLWGVLEYFWGYGKAGAAQEGGITVEEQFKAGGFRQGEVLESGLEKEGHDAQAKRIAEEGRDWAAQVLRREDMLVYVYRLVLEFARVVSEERERMGYVDDMF